MTSDTAAEYVDGCDYAWAPHPTPAELKAAGKVFVCRYLSGDPSKNIDSAELAALRAEGISVVLNWEMDAGAMARGAAQGTADAKTAQAQAAAIGASDAPIYFSADFGADVTQIAACISYMRAVNDVIGVGRSGVYGDYDVCQACKAAGVVSFVWGTAAWDGEPSSWVVDIFQSGSGKIGGDSVDFDYAYGTDYGQWPRPGAPKRKPVTEPVLQEGDTGGAVKLLQSLLNGRPIQPGLTVDGDFGPLTRDAVVRVQTNNHLTVDGIVGPQTWGILGNYT
jgi:Rv2525c-like, glycoside hydrolase-like domain/Putative peptidoglycan binding domain